MQRTNNENSKLKSEDILKKPKVLLYHMHNAQQRKYYLVFIPLLGIARPQSQFPH